MENGDIIYTTTQLEEIAKQVAKEADLNDRQERFCQLYATDREFFGNGVETYLEVYDIDKTKPNWYKTACAAASRLLSNVKVIERINEILEESGLNDAFVDKQLRFLLTQHSDFGAKMNAIKEYNKLRKRISDQVEHKGQVVFVPSELMQKYDISPSTRDNSEGQPQVQGGGLRQEIREDNSGNRGNEGQGSEQERSEDSVHSPNLPAGEGHSLGRAEEVAQTNSNNNQ